MTTKPSPTCAPVEIGDEDVLKAMQRMQGYIDITPADFKEVYRQAYALAMDRLRHAVMARDAMTRPVHLIHMQASLIDTALLLAGKGISGAPVVDEDGRIVGVVSEKDFLVMLGAERTRSFMEVVAHCLKNRGCLATPMRKLCVAEVMSAPAVTAPPEISVGEISKLLMDKKINRLPIVDADHRPLGIITRSDLVQAYCLFS